MAVAAGLGLLLLAGGAVGGYLQFGAAAGTSGSATPQEGAAPKRFAPWAVLLGETTAVCSWQAAALYCSGPGLAAARLDPADGSVVWTERAAAPSPRSATDGEPLHAGGLVLAVAPGSGLLRALSPETGARVWERTLPGGARTMASGGQVLVIEANATVTALDAASGAPRWTKQIGGVGSVWSAGQDPSGAATLYVATPDARGGASQVAAVDPASGAVHWQVRATGRLRPLGVARGGLFLLDTDTASKTSAVVRVDLATRAPRRVPLSAPLYDTEATVGPDGVVYAFGGSGGLAAVGPSREQWRLETGVSVASRPAVADGRVYLTASDGRLLAVDTGTGQLAGQTKPRMKPGRDTFAATLPAPVVAAGKVYASAPDGSVFAVDGANPAGW